MRQVVEVIKRGRRGADGASGVIATVRTDSNITLAVQNRGVAVIADDAITVTLPTAAAVGQGWSCVVFAVGGAVTLTSESEIAGSVSDYTLPAGSSAQILTDGNEYLLQFYLASNLAAVGTDSVANQSTVPGASATAALNALLALLGAWGSAGSAPLIANIDATNTAANLYRFDGTTTGTRPGAWSSGDDGVILILRQSATQALEIGKANGVAGIFYREMDASIWGAWARLDVPLQSQATWNAGTSTEESTITPAKFAAAVTARQAAIHVIDQKASGTNGDATVATTWATRTLNTTLFNTIPGASVAANVVTLPAGRYRIEASDPAYNTDHHRLRLYNVTAAAEIMEGPGVYARSSADAHGVPAELKGFFTLASASAVRLEHWCTFGSGSSFFGLATSSGGPEIYASVIIEWLGPA